MSLDMQKAASSKLRRVIHVILFLVAWVACTVGEAYGISGPTPLGISWVMAVPVGFLSALLLAIVVAIMVYYVRKGL